MSKLVEISAKTVKDFVQFKGSKKGELLNCSKCLYVKRRILSNGKKGAWWVFRSQNPKYYYQFSTYDLMTLQQARLKALEISSLLSKDKDPKAMVRTSALKIQEEEEKFLIESKTFGQVAEDWFKAQIKGKKWKNDPTGEQHTETNLRLHILPVLRDRKIKSFTWRDVYDVMAYEDLYASKNTAARKCRAIINSICDFASSEGWTEAESPAVVKGPLAYKLKCIEVVSSSEHQPALPYEQIPEFFKQLSSIDSIGARALEFAILTASRQGQIVKSVRDGEICGAKWSDFDLERGVWRVPAKIVKTKTDFDCFLSTYAVHLLRRIPQYEGCPWVFTSNGKEPISNGCMLQTIKRMNEQRRLQKLQLWVDLNHKDKFGNPRQITTHGTARSTFRTWVTSDVNENYKHFNYEAVEICLAHCVGDKFGGAYNRPTLENSRREIMEAWGRYCCEGKYVDEG